MLSLGIVFAFGLDFLKLFGGHALADPAPVHLHAAIGKVGIHDHVRPSLHHVYELIVDVPIADAMREVVDARSENSLGILQRIDMSDRL